MKIKLQYQFLVPILGVLILGTALMTFLSNRASQEVLKESIRSEMEQVVDALAKHIDSWMSYLEREVETASRRSVFRRVLAPGLDEARRKAAIDDANAAFREMVELNETYDVVGVADKTGAPVASSDPSSLQGVNIADRPYFKANMKGASSFFVTSSRATGKAVLVTGQPVLDNAGKPAGSLFVSVSLDDFARKYVSPVRIAREGYAYIMDETGLLIAHPDPQHLLKTNLTTFGATAGERSQWAVRMLREEQGFQEYVWNGAKKIVAYHRVPETGWVVAAGAELDDVFAPLATIRNRNILLAGLTTLGVAAVIVLAILPIVRALNRGVRFADAIRTGDLSTRLKMRRGDEIGALADALDQMADGLERKSLLAKRIATGDLAVDAVVASDKDTLGLALKSMTDSLNDLIGRIDESTMQVSSGASQVSDASQSLSQGATEQAASLEEITSSMTQMGSQIKANAENASRASKLCEAARGSAEKGSERMDEMVAAMGEINDSSGQIAKIIKVIDDIAFQTNLLALNAAVEAARAGQHGKGFAVVAEEVRNLAARSAKAARETAQLIEDSVQKAEKGGGIAHQTAEALKEIVEGVTRVTDLVGEIAAASNEQAQGISQASSALSQIDSVTQQNTANAQETASAAEELSSQAAELRHILTRFKLRDTTRRSAGPARTSPEKGPEGRTPKLAAPQEDPWPAVSTSNGGATPEDPIRLDDADFGKY